MARKGEFSTTKGYKDFVNIHLTLINLFPGSEKYLRLPDKTHFVKLFFMLFWSYKELVENE